MATWDFFTPTGKSFNHFANHARLHCWDKLLRLHLRHFFWSLKHLQRLNSFILRPSVMKSILFHKWSFIEILQSLSPNISYISSYGPCMAGRPICLEVMEALVKASYELKMVAFCDSVSLQINSFIGVALWNMKRQSGQSDLHQRTPSLADIPNMRPLLFLRVLEELMSPVLLVPATRCIQQEASFVVLLKPRHMQLLLAGRESHAETETETSSTQNAHSRSHVTNSAPSHLLLRFAKLDTEAVSTSQQRSSSSASQLHLPLDDCFPDALAVRVNGIKVPIQVVIHSGTLPYSF